MLKNKLKSKKGITLIALVVTIVVLLILAGISISLVLGENGIISKAKEARIVTRAGTVQDEVEMWKSEKFISKYSEQTSLTSEELIDSQKLRGLLTEEEANTAKATGKVEIGNITIKYREANATISLDSNEVTIIKGKIVTMEPIIEPTTSDLELTWSSSNTAIATVKDGKINAIANGKTTITCEIVDQSDSKVECVVNVSDGSEIYALGRGREYLDFKNIPNNAKLHVWAHYLGVNSSDHTYVNNPPTYIVPDQEADTGAYTDMYYRLQDSYGNFSEYYYFYVDQLCFVKDTKITTPNGKKNIQDIKVGDTVYSMNMEKKQVEEKKVIQTFKNVVDYKTAKIYIGDENIECTTGHEIYTLNKGWVKAAYLEVGDVLLSKNKEQKLITNIELVKEEENIEVYNFEVEDNHNYFVGEKEYLVHNPPELACDVEGNIYRGSVLEL